MNFNKKETQEFFKDLFSPLDWSKTDKKFYNEHIHDKILLSDSEKVTFHNIMIEESQEYYFKGLLSYLEAITGIKNKLYSWSVVKLYYSLFYLARAEMANNKKVFVRHMRQLYFYDEGKFEKCKNSNDHEMTFEEIPNNDYLRSNAIVVDGDEVSVFNLIKNLRECANYQSKSFFEPEIPADISNYFCDVTDIRGELNFVVNNFEETVFQQEYTAIAVPLYKIHLLKNEGCSNLPSEKRKFLEDNFDLFEYVICDSSFLY
ncbi:hypothetical protein [Enterococcus sp. AZ192]|uniref:hypothetical protein n=1 Tax=unclassified Enterococcus TaxID=2608891 RepID=UPI003D292162